MRARTNRPVHAVRATRGVTEVTKGEPVDATSSLFMHKIDEASVRQWLPAN